MKNIINYFKTAPMSKKLTVVVSAAWIISIAVGHLLLALFKIDLSPMVQFVQSAFLVVLGFYFAKSGAENILGVKNTQDFIQKVIDKTTPNP